MIRETEGLNLKETDWICGWQPVLSLCKALKWQKPITVKPKKLWVDQKSWQAKRDQLQILVQQGVPVHQVSDLCSVPAEFRQSYQKQKIVCTVSVDQLVVAEDDWLKYQCVLVCDGIQDPQNLGSLCRLACALGVDAIVLPKHNQVPINPVVRRVAQGATELIPIVTVNNLVRWIIQRQQQGYWVYGTSEHGQTILGEQKFDAVHTVIVMGSEGKGLRRLVKEHCDTVIRIDTAEHFKSLNVVQAASMVLYDYRRQLLNK